eukprot:TRINITY_DN15875_c1_g1_i2.p2 TRINITY_DN15875_c1_g1~~TRINITY_DN15875_c1_g1_i2.p2  ORF type:complete len:107 (-),score=26.71 TRINITY_DN15875_c1_g1_i2:319-639(-)
MALLSLEGGSLRWLDCCGGPASGAANRWPLSKLVAISVNRKRQPREQRGLQEVDHLEGQRQEEGRQGFEVAEAPEHHEEEGLKQLVDAALLAFLQLLQWLAAAIVL